MKEKSRKKKQGPQKIGETFVSEMQQCCMDEGVRYNRYISIIEIVFGVLDNSHS